MKKVLDQCARDLLCLRLRQAATHGFLEAGPFVCRGLILCLAMGLTAVVAAQPYPTHPIRLVVPFAPGGGIDYVARLSAQRLQGLMQHNVIVDNRPGGGGINGSDIVAKSQADGYTLLAVPISHAVNISLNPKLPFHPQKDFAPIIEIASAPNIVLIHPALAATDVTQLLRLAKAQPNGLTYASSGLGSSTHLASELFQMLANIQLLHVPYKGGGPALADLIGGQVAIYFASLPASAPHMSSGRVRGLAVTGQKRSLSQPHLPTVTESGVPGYEYVGWYGLLAPKATSSQIVSKINTMMNRALEKKDFAERLATDGAEPVGGTSLAFGNLIQSEIEKWAKVVQHMNGVRL